MVQINEELEKNLKECDVIDKDDRCKDDQEFELEIKGRKKIDILKYYREYGFSK